MDYFVNKLELCTQNYQTDGTVRDNNHKGKFSFPMKDFVSFGIDRQPMYFMSTILLKYRIDGFRFPQFQLTNMCDKKISKYIKRGGRIKSFNLKSGRME